MDGVGAGRDDGSVVIRIRVRGARDGREEWVRRVAVPAGCFAHFGQVHSPCADGPDACVTVLLFAFGAGLFEQVPAVTCESLLDSVFAHDGVGETGDVANVVTGPCADGVRFEDRSGVFYGVGLLAYADLAVILSNWHAAFGRAVAAGHDAAVAVGLVEGYFIASPENDPVGWRGLGQAVGLFVGEQWGRGCEEEKGRV